MTRTAALPVVLALTLLPWSAGTPGPGASPLPTAALGGRPDASWRTSSLWDDGKAEFGVYDVQWFRYGGLRPGKAMLIVVKEPWSTTYEVKADKPGADSFDVLKLNHIRDVRTGIYEYHQMASVFARRDDGSLRKLATTSSEACGLSTADMTRGRLRTRSYWDGQGDREQAWPADALPADGLALQLRDWVAGDPPEKLSIFPSLLTGRFPELAPTSWSVKKTDAGSLTVPAGTFPAVTLTLSSGEQHMRFSFEKAQPHRLIEYQGPRGTIYRLSKSERLPYWSMNRPGGEAWLPK